LKIAVSANPRPADREAEYSLYVFDRALPGKWEKHQSFRMEREAVNQARYLFGTGNYPRIEIKKTYFDRRAQRQKDVTFKTFGRKLRKNQSSPLIRVGIALAFGLAALVLTYLSSHS
jgi:hypothetical protein